MKQCITAWIFVFICSSAFAENLAFTHVNVRRDGMIFPDQTILVSGDSIEALGGSKYIKIPKGYRKINCKKKCMIPGLADMHAHLAGPQGENMPMEDYLFLHVSQGVTTIRSMRGELDHLELRERVEKGDVISPTLILSSPWFTPDTALTADSAAKLVKHYKDMGYDLIKVLGNVDSTLYEAIAAACKENDIPLAGHLPQDVPVSRALELKIASIEHVMGYKKATDGDYDKMDAAAKQTAEAGVWNCPTLDFYSLYANLDNPEKFANRKGLEYMPDSVRQEWHRILFEPDSEDVANKELYKTNYQFKQQMTAALAKAGAPLLISASQGAYIVPGFSMLEEMRDMHDGGVPVNYLLESATVSAAKCAGEDDEWGTIRSGLRADMVLLKSNPGENLDALEDIEGVVLRGQWLSKEEIDARLAEIAARNRNP